MKTKLLTPEELKALEQLPVSQFDKITDAEYLEFLLKQSGQLLFYKMPFIGNLRDVEYYRDKPEVVPELLKTLKATMKDLGEIAAIDLFIGNDDRFDGRGRVVNPGNIIFQNRADGSYKAVGLDFFAARNKAANLCMLPPDDWSGEILKAELSMKSFAAAAISSLNNLCEKQKFLGRKLTEDERLTEDETRNFYSGMKSGAGKLRDYFQKRFLSEKPLPGGVLHRMQRLNW